MSPDGRSMLTRFRQPIARSGATRPGGRHSRWSRARAALLALAALGYSVGMPTIAAPQPAPDSIARVGRVLLVSIDGLRADLVPRAQAPTLHGLMERGCYTLWAQTVTPPVTLPSHTSMLTGVTPERHGIRRNNNPPFAYPPHPESPTLFELARNAGFTTAMVAGKSKFSALEVPGALDWSFVPEFGSVPDSQVMDSALAVIEEHRPQVLFVNLPGPDGVGHRRGWGSSAQLEAIALSDRCVGRLLAALEAQSLLDSTVVLVSADHGGSGRSHRAGDPASYQIPWIVAGPGIRENVDLAAEEQVEVHTEDTFATIVHLLGLTPPPSIDGHAMTRILVSSAAR